MRRSRWLGAFAICAWLSFAAQATGLFELDVFNPLASSLGCAHSRVRGTPPPGISNGITLRFEGRQVDVPRGQLVLVQGKRYTLVGVDPARNSLVLEEAMGMFEIPLADINTLIVPRVGHARAGIALGAAAGGAVVGVVVGMMVGGNKAGLDGMLRGCLLGGVIGGATGALAGVSLTRNDEYGLKDHTWQITLLDKLPPAPPPGPAPAPVDPWSDARPAARPVPAPIVAPPAPAPAPRLPLRIISPPPAIAPAPEAPPPPGGLAPFAPPAAPATVPDAPPVPASPAP